MVLVDSIIRRTRQPTVQWFLTQNFVNNFVRYSVVINITRKKSQLESPIWMNPPRNFIHTQNLAPQETFYFIVRFHIK